MDSLEFIKEFVELQNILLIDYHRYPELSKKRRKFKFNTYEAVIKHTDRDEIILRAVLDYAEESNNYTIIFKQLSLDKLALNEAIDYKESFYRMFIYDVLQWFSLSKDCELNSVGWENKYNKFYSAATLIIKGL